jgi:hypothetical protein
MRRSLLAIALGITFLIVMTWIGTLIANIVPHRPTAQVQTAQAGPYSVTLEVDPNPPPITSPATLSFQVTLASSQAPIDDATVVLENSMTTMDMGTDREQAQHQGSGLYRAHVQFSMSGPWQVLALISRPGSPSASVTFDVTAQ